MPHAVGGGEVKQRFVSGTPRGDVVHVSRRAVGQKYWSGLRAERKHMTRAVIFLVAPRALVFFDHVTVVLVERKAGSQAKLLVVAHSQSIEVHGGFVFDNESVVL